MPDKPSKQELQAELLKIARQGSSHWNAWQKQQPEVEIDFSGIDFRQLEKGSIDFSNFIFSGGANFSGAKFGIEVDLNKVKFGNNKVKFGNRADFTFGNKANFSGAKFPDKVDFSGAQFGNGADFTGADFPHQANFSHTQFGKGTRFIRAQFSQSINFSHATFDDQATFYGAIFSGGANFSHATFGDKATFSEAKFGRRAFFSHGIFQGHVGFCRTEFNGDANFHKTEFLSTANFFRAIFSNGANFSESQFGDQVIFSKAQFEADADFVSTKFSYSPDFGEATFKKTAYFHIALSDKNLPSQVERDENIWSASFAGARFEGEVSFAYRNFRESVTFREAVFSVVPFVEGASFPSDCDFFETKFQDLNSERAEQGYRTFKRLMKESENFEEAHKFFILEMKARQKKEWQHWCQELPSRLRKKWQSWFQKLRFEWVIAKASSLWQKLRFLLKKPVFLMSKVVSLSFWQIALWLYWILSDYGRSFWRPFIAWGITICGFYVLYARKLTGEMTLFFDGGWALFIFSLAQGLPLIGSTRGNVLLRLEEKFCPSSLSPEKIQICLDRFLSLEFWAYGQAVIGFILIFLLLLALRNRFRIG